MLSSILFIVASVWLFLSLLLYFFQANYIYYPYKRLESKPSAIGLPFEDVTLITSDEKKLHGWWIPHPEPRYTLLFLHGNAGNISHRLQSIEQFHELDLSVFIFDYQGYGQSEGKPGEKGTYRDAEAAWTYLVEERQIKPEEIIIFGRSLGGAVASWLAAKNPAAAVILESTFTSVADMGRHYYPYLPVRLINHIKYDNISRIDKIDSPLLVIHSQEDEIVPFRLGQELFQAATPPKQFLEIQGGHNYGYLDSATRYTQGIDRFIEGLEQP